MEKYSTYRDQATGIAPFLPNKHASRSILVVVGQYITGVIVFPITVFGLVASWLLALIPGLSQLVFSTLARISLRLFYVDLSYEGERKASVRRSDIQRAQPGDVIVSNFTSPLDPIVYSGFFPCQFVFPNAGKFVPASLWGACGQALSLDLVQGAGEPLENIVKQAKRAGKVIVLFGEGTTTNGKGVLSLKQVNWPEVAPLKTNVFTSAIKYTPNTTSSPLGGSYIGYFLGMQTTIWWCMATIQVSKPLATSSRNKLGAGSALSISSRTKLIGDELDIYAKQKFYKVSKN